MKNQHILLLAINIIGGMAVIGSYIFGIDTQPAGADVLWGGIPTNIRPIYAISMVLAALGYFAFSYYIFFKIDPQQTDIGGIFNFSFYYLIFVLILIPSAFWMPLTNIYIDSPGTGLWIGICSVLAVVGLTSIALLWSFINLKPRIPGLTYWLAVAGSGYFAFHTAILDAIIWTALFK